MYVPLIREEYRFAWTMQHDCREHALGVSGVVRKQFHGSSICGKSHPPSVLCLDGTTTKGTYPKRF